MSAGVIAAKVIWNRAKAFSGKVRPERTSARLARNRLFVPPSHGAVPSNTRLYPAMAQSSDTPQAMAKQCISTESTLRARTSPP
jgi:hypothetical protein